MGGFAACPTLAVETALMTARASAGDRHLRFGTRGSALALAQTDLAVARLKQTHPDITVATEIIRTEGDIDVTSPLTEIGGRGVFTNVLELAILQGRVDAAVHSAKDLPSALHPSLPIVAFPDRGDPRDVLVSRYRTTLDRLPPHPVIGTSSRRREAQIRQLRPDARLVSIRGNIDTRLRKAETDNFDAIVLAAAGLCRMGWEARVSEYFPVDLVVPSPGQGAIALQAKAGSDAGRLLAEIDDPAVSVPVRIERAFLAAIGAGCSMPIGAYAHGAPGAYRLVAMLADEAGERVARADEVLAPGDEERHAAEIARRMRLEIGTALAEPVAPGKWSTVEGAGELRVVVTRPRRQADGLLAALARRGAEAIALPTIRIEPYADTSAIDAALNGAGRGEFAWLVFTSANAVEVVCRRLAALGIDPDRLGGLKIAAIGESTARAAREGRLSVALVAQTPTAEGLAADLQGVVGAGSSVLYPRSAIGRDLLPNALRDAGAAVTVIDAYQTVAETEIDPRALAQIRERRVDAITFHSPSSVRHLLRMLGDDRDLLDNVVIVCAGPVTADAARDAGLRIGAVSAEPEDDVVADTVMTACRRPRMLATHAMEIVAATIDERS